MRPAALSALLLALPAVAAAQELAVTAEVNKTTLALDDQAVLTVTVSGNAASLPAPQLPPMPHFNIHGAGQSTNISFINGQVSSSIQHRYILVPRFVGKSAIGPIRAEAGGRSASTQSIEMTVVRPSEAPPGAPQSAPRAGGGRPAGGAGGPRPGAAAPDIFVTAEVDKKRPFVNEQVILDVRFYTAVPLLGNAEWVPPETAGFLGEDLPPGPQRQVAFRGRRYYVSEIRMALFPAQPGTLTIGPSTIRCQVQEEMNVDPFAEDFFQRFFSSGLRTAQTRELRTEPIRLSVQPLPEAGKPAGFTGAVGRFTVSAALDRREAKVGDAVNLTVTVEGAGNLKTVGEPKLPDLGPFRAFETVSSLNLSKGEEGVRGSKVFKTVLVPRSAGRALIPPIPFAYFDTGRGEYARLQTAPLELSVLPGAASEGLKGYVSGATPSAPGITALSEDIRHIKDAGRGRVGGSRRSGTAAVMAAAGWVHAVPLAIFLGCLGLHGYRENLARDPAAARARAALSAAERRLAEARGQLASDPGRGSALLADALTCFLADKLGCPAAGLTRRQAVETLRKRWPRLPEGHYDRLRALWDEVEALRFAPPGKGERDGSHLAEGIIELVRAFEEDMG